MAIRCGMRSVQSAGSRTRHQWWQDGKECRWMWAGQGLRDISEAIRKGFGIFPSLEGIFAVCGGSVRQTTLIGQKGLPTWLFPSRVPRRRRGERELAK